MKQYERLLPSAVLDVRPGFKSTPCSAHLGHHGSSASAPRLLKPQACLLCILGVIMSTGGMNVVRSAQLAIQLAPPASCVGATSQFLVDISWRHLFGRWKGGRRRLLSLNRAHDGRGRVQRSGRRIRRAGRVRRARRRSKMPRLMWARRRQAGRRRWAGRRSGGGRDTVSPRCLRQGRGTASHWVAGGGGGGGGGSGGGGFGGEGGALPLSRCAPGCAPLAGGWTLSRDRLLRLLGLRRRRPQRALEDVLALLLFGDEFRGTLCWRLQLSQQGKKSLVLCSAVDRST